MRDNVGWLINRYHGNIFWGFWENQEKEVILWIIIKIAEKNKWEMLFVRKIPVVLVDWGVNELW